MLAPEGEREDLVGMSGTLLLVGAVLVLVIALLKWEQQHVECDGIACLIGAPRMHHGECVCELEAD